MTVCYLSIGSNLGNRIGFIKASIQKVNSLKDTQVIKVSKIIETRPAGGPRNQPKFLNAALKINTRLSPQQLLKGLKRIEKDLGRVKTVHWGPRVIDLDILFYGKRLINTTQLKIPHPLIFRREFVVKPLLEVL